MKEPTIYERKKAHMRACSPGASRLETLAGYSLAAGLLGEIGGAVLACWLAITGRPLDAGYWILGGAAALLVFAFTGQKTAYVWARRRGFSWDYDRQQPGPPAG